MKGIVYCLVSFLMRLFPINKRKIMLMSYYGQQYGCNPKYISEYITANFSEYDVVWAFTNPSKYTISGVRKVKYMSLRYFYDLYTCKVFITNYRMPKDFKKRSSQLYIQTWHSSLRLKAIEKDAETSSPAEYIQMAKNDCRNVDAIISGCKYSTEIFEHCLWSPCEIIPTGTPRNDLLFKHDDKIKLNVLDRLGIKPNTHIALYAPTFRKGNSLKPYNLNYSAVISSLKRYMDGDWVILLRLHPHLVKYSSTVAGGLDNVIDATSYDDIQELLLISDVLISDYSSLVFDFAITQRPCLLYVPDLQEYLDADRHLYFDITSLPFPIAHSNEELFDRIEHFDKQEYKERLSQFLYQIGSYENGHAAENVMNYIQNKINE